MAMRGFRFLGKIEHVSVNDFHPSDLLFFSPYEEGGSFRGSGAGLRARDFDLFQCQTVVAMGACPSDYVFVATALGEHAFEVGDAV